MKKGPDDIEWILTWVLVGFLFFSVLLAAVELRVFFVLMGGFALFLALYPPIRYRDPTIMPAFELVAILAAPFVLYVVITFMPGTDVLTAIRAAELSAIFATGLVLMIHLQKYHGLILDRILMSFFLVAFTSTLGMFHTLGLFFNDELFGTSFITSNHALMVDMFIAVIGGLVLTYFLVIYMKRRDLYHLKVPEYQRRNGQ